MAQGSTTFYENPIAWYAGGLLVLLLWTAAWYAEGEDRYVRIHDGLSSNVTVLKITSSPEILLAPSGEPIKQIANIPRHCSMGELFLPIWFYRFLPTLWAYAASEFFVRIVAHAGMFLLLHDFLWPSERQGDIIRLALVTALSLCFALLPFWIPGGLDVAGQPLLFWAIANLFCRKQTAISLLISIAFPFFASVILSGVFFLMAIFGWWVLAALWQRKLSWRVAAALCLLTVGWFISSYRLFEGRYADPDFVSMRTEYAGSSEQAMVFRNAKHGYTSELANWEASRSFFSGEDSHAPPKHQPFILGSVAAAIFIGVLCVLFRLWAESLARDTNLLNHQTEANHAVDPPNRERLSKTVGYLAAMFAAVLGCGVTSLWLGWYRTPFWGAAINALPIEVFSEINFARFHWFQPLLWLIAFSFALRFFVEAKTSSRVRRILGIGFAGLMVSCQLSHLTLESEYYTEKSQSGITFREYYAPDLFAQIETAIGREKAAYRVGCVGYHPTAAQENGFYTVDGLMANYPLAHKKAMEKVLAAEFAKNPNLKNQFHTWGAQFYLFSAELTSHPKDERDSGSILMYTKDDSIRRIEQFDINTHALREMDVEYLFSAVEIGNWKELGLTSVGVFRSDESAWEITVYQIPAAEK